MVRTRRRAGFSHDYPVFSALAKRDHERLTALLSEPGAAAACGPGGITPLHAAVLLTDAASIPFLVAAGAPLEAVLTLSANDGGLANWLNLLALESGRERAWRQGDIHFNDTPIFLAARLSAPHNQLVGKALLEAGASPWLLFQPYRFSPYSHQIPHSVATWLMPLISARYEAGQLELSAERLRNFVDAAMSAGGLGVMSSIASVLRMAVARRQPRLGEPEANALLLRAVEQGSAETVSLLLQLGASATASRYGTSVANMAADRANQAVLQVLLKAGAPVSPQLVRSVMFGLRPGLLEVLLQHGPIPSDSSAFRAVGGYWTCPVLCLLSVKPRYSQLRRVLVMAEMLAEAGYRPTIYTNIMTTSGRVVPVFDPLKDAQESEFELDFSNRFTLLPFHPDGWTPRRHHKYPRALQQAVEALLLCAARGRKSAGEAGGARQAGRGCQLLGSLPEELVLHILHLAARQVSVWILE